MLKSPSLRTLDSPMSLYATYVSLRYMIVFLWNEALSHYTGVLVWLQGHLCCLFLDMKIHRSAQDTSSFGRILWWSLKDQREGAPLCSANCSDHRVCPALRTQAWIVWVSKWRKGPGRDMNPEGISTTVFTEQGINKNRVAMIHGLHKCDVNLTWG